MKFNLKLTKLALAIASIAVIFLTGCATNIAKLPITARDQQTYENKFAKEYERNENFIALKIAIIPQNPNIKGQDRRTLTTLKSLTNSCGDHLDSAFSNLADFDVIPRSEIAALVSEQQLVAMTDNNAKEYKIKGADYYLIYRVSSYNFNKFKWKDADKRTHTAYRAYVKIKVSLINRNKAAKEFTKIITGKSKNSDDEQSIELLNSALEVAIKDFSTQFAVEYAPPSIVQQTKGSGQVALLNVGKNYGLMKNMKVEFFFFKEKGKKRRAIPFAYGKIIEIGEETAWAEITDFEEANVKENHFARVRKDQSKSFLEKITEND